MPRFGMRTGKLGAVLQKIGYYKPCVETYKGINGIGLTRSCFGYGKVVPGGFWGGGISASVENKQVKLLREFASQRPSVVQTLLNGIAQGEAKFEHIDLAPLKQALEGILKTEASAFPTTWSPELTHSIKELAGQAHQRLFPPPPRQTPETLGEILPKPEDRAAKAQGFLYAVRTALNAVGDRVLALLKNEDAEMDTYRSKGIFGATRKGMHEFNRNGLAVQVSGNRVRLAVADGLEAGGELAAAGALVGLATSSKNLPQSFEEAHESIVSYHHLYSKMAVSAAAVEVCGDRAQVMHAGDVVVFLVRGSDVKVLNSPQWAIKLAFERAPKEGESLSFKAPYDLEDFARILDRRRELAAPSPESLTLAHALGYSLASEAILEHKLEPGDRLVIATKGVYLQYNSFHLRKALLRTRDAQESARDLIGHLSNKADATVLIYDHPVEKQVIPQKTKPAPEEVLPPPAEAAPVSEALIMPLIRKEATPEIMLEYLQEEVNHLVKRHQKLDHELAETEKNSSQLKALAEECRKSVATLQAIIQQQAELYEEQLKMADTNYKAAINVQEIIGLRNRITVLKKTESQSIRLSILEETLRQAVDPVTYAYEEEKAQIQAKMEKALAMAERNSWIEDQQRQIEHIGNQLDALEGRSSAIMDQLTENQGDSRRLAEKIQGYIKKMQVQLNSLLKILPNSEISRKD